MFSDEVLEKIFMRPELKPIPLNEQSIMIKVIESVLEEMEDKDATIPNA